MVSPTCQVETAVRDSSLYWTGIIRQKQGVVKMKGESVYGSFSDGCKKESGCRVIPKTGGHVARVLLVAGSVRDDELALGCGEIAIGDVDGDALLAFGPTPSGATGESTRPVGAPLTR